MKRSPLRRVGKQHAWEKTQYHKQATAFKKAHPYCAVSRPGCTFHTQDVHHVFGRGKYLLVESTWLPVCRSCHRFIHENPGTARTLNLLK